MHVSRAVITILIPIHIIRCTIVNLDDLNDAKISFTSPGQVDIYCSAGSSILKAVGNGSLLNALDILLPLAKPGSLVKRLLFSSSMVAV